MGLDIYFSKATRKAWGSYREARERFNKMTDAQKRLAEKPSLENKDCGYFRKVNFLMSFFDYDGNCIYRKVTKEKMEQLVSSCKQVLQAPEQAGELLPTQSGFFYGSTEYDSSYFNDVESVKMWAESILSDTDWEQDVVLMYCWW